jgi:hypothetical protein
VHGIVLRHIPQIRATWSLPITQRKKTFAVQIGRWQQAREEQNEPGSQSWPDKIHSGSVLIYPVGEVGVHLGVIVITAMEF